MSKEAQVTTSLSLQDAKGKINALVPFSKHLSWHDLTQHGILIFGQGYQSLLEFEGDNFYATKVFGQIFGRYGNLHD